MKFCSMHFFINVLKERKNVYSETHVFKIVGRQVQFKGTHIKRCQMRKRNRKMDFEILLLCFPTDWNGVFDFELLLLRFPSDLKNSFCV